MKHKNKLKRLNGRVSDFKSDRTVQAALTKAPGSYKQPGSLKK